MPIIDAHHHLWDLERHHYPWLASRIEHPAGDLEPIRQSYRIADFLHDARHQDVIGSVHLQAEMGDPLAETAWLQEVADGPGHGFPHAIVAYANLADPGVEAVLERHCRHRNMRGIRYMLNHEDGEPLYCAASRSDWLRDETWRKGYARCALTGSEERWPAGSARRPVRCGVRIVEMAQGSDPVDGASLSWPTCVLRSFLAYDKIVFL